MDDTVTPGEDHSNSNAKFTSAAFELMSDAIMADPSSSMLYDPRITEENVVPSAYTVLCDIANYVIVFSMVIICVIVVFVVLLYIAFLIRSIQRSFE